jgi:hypothetical protein
MAKKKSRRSTKESRGTESKGPSLKELTPAELAGLDFLIKDMEERGGTISQVGFLPGVIVGFLVRRAVVWLVERVFYYVILRALLRGATGLEGLSAAEIRNAEEVLKGMPEPSLADLKKVRSLIKEKKA